MSGPESGSRVAYIADRLPKPDARVVPLDRRAEGLMGVLRSMGCVFPDRDSVEVAIIETLRDVGSETDETWRSALDHFDVLPRDQSGTLIEEYIDQIGE